MILFGNAIVGVLMPLRAEGTGRPTAVSWPVVTWGYEIRSRGLKSPALEDLVPTAVGVGSLVGGCGKE